MGKIFDKQISEYLAKNGFEMFHPKVVFFDMDGILYDSMPNHAYSWHHSMSSFGLDMSFDDAYRHEGMRGVETIKHIAYKQWKRKITEEEAQKIYEVKCNIFASCPQVAIMKGVKELQNLMIKSGMRIAVVTGSGQRSLLNKLLVDFKDIIDPSLIVSAFDVCRGKPSPDPYIKGLNTAKVKAAEAIVVENAPLGVRSAVAAHIFTVAINTGPLPDSALYNSGANLVFENMKEFKKAWPNLLSCTLQNTKDK